MKSNNFAVRKISLVWIATIILKLEIFFYSYVEHSTLNMNCYYIKPTCLIRFIYNNNIDVLVKFLNFNSKIL